MTLFNKLIVILLFLVITDYAELDASPRQDPDRPTTVWKADTAHSSIQFKIQHWGIVDLVGWFDDFEVTVYSEKADFTDAVIEAKVQMASIRMPNTEMAENARRLFGVAEWPAATFYTKSITIREDGHLKFEGDLKLHGVTLPIIWDVQRTGTVGTKSHGFRAIGTVDRFAFKVGDAETLPNDDRLFIGQLAEVICNIQLDLFDWKTIFDK